MEILLNELSLTGQFKDENDFFDSFDSILEIIKLIDMLNFSIAKEYSFFDVTVTSTYKLGDFLKIRTDRARKMKRFLAKLAHNPPFWNDTKKHNCVDNTYIYNSSDICSTSLAESCERDKIILSFMHNDFLTKQILIQKNTKDINIYNLIDKYYFLEYLLSIFKIEPLTYCQLKFENTKLNFTEINIGYGFDGLETIQQIKEFLEAFTLFDKTNWEDIIKSDGLEYKKYSPSKKNDWFKETHFRKCDIYKFRVTQKYRCFGYREDNTFFVLRFEIDHKMSDNG